MSTTWRANSSSNLKGKDTGHLYPNSDWILCLQHGGQTALQIWTVKTQDTCILILSFMSTTWIANSSSNLKGKDRTPVSWFWPTFMFTTWRANSSLNLKGKDTGHLYPNSDWPLCLQPGGQTALQIWTVKTWDTCILILTDLYVYNLEGKLLFKFER